MKNILLISILLIGFPACNSKKDQTNTPAESQADTANKLPEGFVILTDNQIKSIGLEVRKAEQLAIGGTIRVTGRLDVPPQNQVSVSAPFPGFIRWTNVLQGARVVKGQRIATVYNPDLLELQKRFAQAQASELYQKKELGRQTSLRADEINSQKTLERARADYSSAKAEAGALGSQIKALGLNPSNATSLYDIHAPMSGYISRVDVNIGKQVAVGQDLFEIVNLDHLHAELFVFEKDAARVKVGQRIRFSLPGEQEASRTATVYLVGRTLEQDRTIRVHGHIDKEDSGLIPGLYLQGLIETDTGKVLAVPEEAIVRSGGKTYVFVPASGKNESDGKTFMMIEAKTGATELGFTQIAPVEKVDFAQGIVTKGAFYLLSTLKAEEGGEE